MTVNSKHVDTMSFYRKYITFKPCRVMIDIIHALEYVLLRTMRQLTHFRVLLIYARALSMRLFQHSIIRDIFP